MFTLHPQLNNDCFHVTDLSLCQLLMMNDANYPWFVLVPMRENTTEIFQLNESDQNQLIKESSTLSKFLVRQFQPEKINVAALGNVVPQLHVHHIARFKTDSAWPAPVWGKCQAKKYTDDAANTIIDLTRAAFNG